jgi:hypothetical protein
MRNRWEGGAADELDAPATLTERELRALRRRAGFALPAVLLGLVALGAVSWTLYSGAEGLERIQGMKAGFLERTSGTESPAAAAATATQGPDAADAMTSSAIADSTSAAGTATRDSARAAESTRNAAR